MSQESYVDSVLHELMYYDEEELLYMEVAADKAFHFVYANSSYSNRTYYAGREVGDPQYYLSGQVSYFNSYGFFMGLGTSSGTWFSANNNANYNNAFMLGYGKALKKLNWLRYNLTYSRYFGFNNGFDFSSTYSNNLHWGMSTKFNWFGCRAGLNYLFGSDSKLTLNWEVYSSFTLIDWGRFNRLKLEPELSFFYDSEEVEHTGNNGELSYHSAFGWMNTELCIPLILNIRNFDVELSYVFNRPRSLDPAYEYDPSSLFNLSVGYIFEL